MISNHSHFIRALSAAHDETTESRCIAMADRARERLQKEAATRPLLLAEMRKQRGRERVDAPEKGKGYCYGEGTQRINGRSTLTPAALEQVRAYIADGSKRPTLFAAKAGIARGTLTRHAKILRKAAQ